MPVIRPPDWQKGIQTMITGIIGAMDVEIAELRNRMNIRQISQKAGMTFVEGSIGRSQVVLAKSGVGKVNAGCCAQILADTFHVTHIINTGVAGSLNNDINIGDIVVSTGAMYHDVDVTVLGYQKGEIPQLGVKVFPADEMMRAAAVRAIRETAPEVGVFEGLVLSGDQFISSKAHKSMLQTEFKGFCTEMEGAAIAHMAWLNHIPFVIIRAISDKADESVSVSYEQFEAQAAMHCAKMVLYMIQQDDAASPVFS